LNCLEVISVRIAQEHEFDDALRLCTEVSLPVEPGRFMGMSVYRSNGYGSDLIVNIHWAFDSSGQKKSLLGLQLARGLSNYGIVSHTMWIDQHVHLPGILA